MSHGASGASLMGGTGGGVLQCQRGRERVRRTPFVSHDARRTGLPRRRRLDAGGGLVFRWRGGEAIEGRHGEAWWGARRRWRTEWMGKKNGEKRGAGSTVALMAARWRGRRGKGSRGPGFGVTWMGKWGRERGPRRGGGQLEQPTIAPGRRARVAPLPHDRGGGGTRATRAREAGRRDQVTSGPSGQRLGVGGSERERGNGGSGC
jgi:hypothetical protein